MVLDTPGAVSEGIGPLPLPRRGGLTGARGTMAGGPTGAWGAVAGGPTGGWGARGTSQLCVTGGGEAEAQRLLCTGARLVTCLQVWEPLPSPPWAARETPPWPGLCIQQRPVGHPSGVRFGSWKRTCLSGCFLLVPLSSGQRQRSAMPAPRGTCDLCARTSGALSTFLGVTVARWADCVGEVTTCVLRSDSLRHSCRPAPCDFFDAAVAVSLRTQSLNQRESRCAPPGVWFRGAPTPAAFPCIQLVKSNPQRPPQDDLSAAG